MKKTLRRICSVMLVIAMVLALCPTFLQNVYAEEGEPISSPDEAVIASTVEDRTDPYNVYQYNKELFYEVVAIAKEEYSTATEVKDAVERETNPDAVTLTYGDVKEITDFTIDDESEVVSLYNLSVLLPNLDSITISKATLASDYETLNYLPTTLKSISLSAHNKDENQNSAYMIYLGNLSSFANLETLNINADSIVFYQNFSLPAGVKNLTLAKSNNEYMWNETSVATDVINSLSNLESLDVSGNYFAGSINFAGFANLKTLVINNCNLTSNTFPDLTGLTNLTGLSIAGNSRLSKVKALAKVPSQFANDEEWIARNFTYVNEAVTTGELESYYYIPDQNLYATLLQTGDRDNDGILTVGEASAITSLNSYMGAPVTTFKGLSTVAPNITSVYLGRSSAEWSDYFGEISKLQSLNNISVSVYNQDELNDVFGLEGLKTISLYIGAIENPDISNISALTDLGSLSLSFYSSSSEIVGVSSLNSLSKLYSLSVNNSSMSIEQLDDALLGQLTSISVPIKSEDELAKIEKLTEARSLSLYCNGDSKYCVDLSELNNLSSISLSGNMERVILPEASENLGYISLNNYVNSLSYLDSSKLATLENLDKYNKVKEGSMNSGVYNLYITGFDIGDFKDICNMSSLTSLSLDNCNITDTEGIGNLVNLNNLYLRNNFNLTTIDEGISNLKKIRSLNLGYNGLTSLPDISALCTEEGLLHSLDSYETSFSGRVNLEGNELNEDAVKESNLDAAKFLNDKNWMTKATARKFISADGYVNTYYTNLNSTYLWSQLENASSNVGYGIYTNQGVVLDSEFVSFIKSKNIYLSIYILDVNDNYTINSVLTYSVTPYVLGTWTSGDIELSKLDISYENSGDFDDWFNGDVLGEIKVSSDKEITTYASVSLNVSNFFDTETKYKVYKYDGINFQKYGEYYQGAKNIYININSTGKLEDIVYLVTDYNASLYNDVAGAFCDKEVVALSDFSVVADGKYVDSEWVANDWEEKLNVLVDAATTGDTIKIATKNYNTRLSKDTVKKLADKEIKLVVYSAFSSSADYMNVDSVSTYDFGKASENISAYPYINVYRGSLYFNKYISDYYPNKLFNDVKSTYVNTYVPGNIKMYVGTQYANGDKLYLYRNDYMNNQVVLEGEYTVSYGCVNLSIPTTDSYIIADTQISNTKWESAPIIDNPGTATGGNATEDTESDKCKDGHKWENKTVTDPTCVENGTGIRTCSVCGAQEEYIIPAIGHIWDETYTVDKKATATEDGSKSIYCSVCKTLKPDSTVIIEKYGVEVTLPTIEATEVTSEFGVKSAPASVDQTKIVSKSEAVTTLINKMTETIAPSVEVYTTGVIPTMTADLFTAASENNKNITMGAVNDDNQLIYSWTFDYDSIDASKVPEGGLNLAISFKTDKAEEIKKITGQDNALYISIDGYHGELPGPATVKTYVGNKYKNGEIVYIYYYNEETGKVELAGNSALVVREGYVEYELRHCSTYFITEDEPEKYGINVNGGSDVPAVESPAPTTSQNASLVPIPAKASPKTGDKFPFIPLACVIAGLSIVGYVISFRKKEII